MGPWSPSWTGAASAVVREPFAGRLRPRSPLSVARLPAGFEGADRLVAAAAVLDGRFGGGGLLGGLLRARRDTARGRRRRLRGGGLLEADARLRDTGAAGTRGKDGLGAGGPVVSGLQRGLGGGARILERGSWGRGRRRERALSAGLGGGARIGSRRFRAAAPPPWLGAALRERDPRRPRGRRRRQGTSTDCASWSESGVKRTRTVRGSASSHVATQPARPRIAAAAASMRARRARRSLVATARGRSMRRSTVGSSTRPCSTRSVSSSATASSISRRSSGPPPVGPGTWLRAAPG